jgi:hypothetical protein
MVARSGSSELRPSDAPRSAMTSGRGKGSGSAAAASRNMPTPASLASVCGKECLLQNPRPSATAQENNRRG